MAYSNRYTIGDPIHFCDECAAAIEERPVEQALLEAAHQTDTED